jgi:hypothetical protein
MLAIDPANTQILYAANDDGVYKSSDGAATWNATSLMASSDEQYFANSVVMDQSNPSTVYAGTVNGVFKSTDSGATWTAMTTGFTESTEITHLAGAKLLWSTYLGDRTTMARGRSRWTGPATYI